MVTINGAPAFWHSKASSLCFDNPAIGEAHADMSSAAAEVCSPGNATLEIIPFSNADEMGLDFPKPFILEMDNDAACTFTNYRAQKTKLKHIDCSQERVQTLRNKVICIPAHLPTVIYLADIFTKILDALRLSSSFGTGS